MLGNKSILITGGAGYIGSHLVALLGEQGYDLIIYDNFSTGRAASVLYGNLIQADLADMNKLEAVFRYNNIDAVFHFAGSIIVPESIEKPLDYYYNNTANSLNLIRLCSKYNVNKFIFSSTAATYGSPKNGIAKETSPQKPINPYGVSKLITEWMLRDYSKINSNFKFVALRYFNVSGADSKGRIGQCFPGATHLIKVACEAATNKRGGVKIFGTDYPTPDGTCIRDYIHVEDLADAHLKVYDYLVNGGDSDFMNCGYGKKFSVREVIETVKRVTGVNFKVEECVRRMGDPPILISEANKIKKLTGWIPKYDNLEFIIKTAYEWERKLS